jgi:hypothetical protein
LFIFFCNRKSDSKNFCSHTLYIFVS